MIIVMGKTCSGKDSIIKELCNNYGYKRIISYTTRPIRKNENDGITYRYISEEEFVKRIESGFFAEWKSYNTEFGVWYYGCSVEDIENANDKNIIILTPDGYRDIVDKLCEKPFVIYVYSNNSTIKNRLKKRGDNKDEAYRRILKDNEDFKDVERIVDKIVYNNDTNNISEVANKIDNYIKER